MATDLVTIATTAVLSQFLGPSAKHFGELMLERGKQVGSKAVAMLAAVGRGPQAVEPKVLLPLVQAAALETDTTLTELWAALLANAADPIQQAPVQPGFVEVLRQLTPTDALLLDSLYYPPKGSGLIAGQRMLKQFSEPGLDYAGVTLSVGNLIRLHLCAGRAEKAGLFHDPDRPTTIAATPFGRQFMQACSAPTA